MKKIQTVCGFGIGTSLMLKITLEGIIREKGLEAEVICGDVSSCLSNECDVIFVSTSLADTISSRATVPLVLIDNFMDQDELTQKLLDFLNNK